MARPICFRLLTHCMRRAASRAAWTAGKSRAIRTAMMAITTRSSISVKPGIRDLGLHMGGPRTREPEGMTIDDKTAAHRESGDDPRGMNREHGFAADCLVRFWVGSGPRPIIRGLRGFPSSLDPIPRAPLSNLGFFLFDFRLPLWTPLERPLSIDESSL